VVRTPGFHPGNRSSILLWAARNKKEEMANHKSALKRVRSDEKKRLRNKYQHKTTRNAIKSLRATKDKKEAEKSLPAVFAMIDKIAKKNIIHKNKAANLKSSLQLHVNGL
jgi:small subunit ribosomal protein S20